MAEIMIYGLMVNAKNRYPGTMILMKSLLVPLYEKQRKELHHEIFWKHI